MDDPNRSQAQKLSHAKPWPPGPGPRGKPRLGLLDEGEGALNTLTGAADYREGHEGRDALTGKINGIVTLTGTKKDTFKYFLW